MSHLNDPDAAARSEAARALGRARTPRKVASATETLEAVRGRRWEDPEARKKFGEAMKQSWARRKAEQGPQESPEPKRPRGRPRKERTDG